MEAAQQDSLVIKKAGTDVVGDSHSHVAIIFGVTGLVGKQLARKLLLSSWKVYGVARNADITTTSEPVPEPLHCSENYRFISCDLLSPSEARQKLAPLRDVTHIFWVTWATNFPLDTPECCAQNRSMMSNALDAILLSPGAISTSLRHVSLQTGTKHYVSLSPPSDQDRDPECCCYAYDEDSPRVPAAHNFYYSLEDLLRERLAWNGKLTWSVLRPGLVIGSSTRSVYNFMGSLCVYGAICKRLNLPFVFGGTRQCWEETCIDGSDARLVADQHIWAAVEAPGGQMQAFNAVNGDGFTWREVWPTIGKKFGVEVASEGLSLEFRFAVAMADQGGVWAEIVAEEGLVATDMGDLANWGFLDALFRCPVKLVGTRQKADRWGFTQGFRTLDSILYWVDFMRSQKLIP